MKWLDRKKLQASKPYYYETKITVFGERYSTTCKLLPFVRVQVGHPDCQKCKNNLCTGKNYVMCKLLLPTFWQLIKIKIRQRYSRLIITIKNIFR